MISASMSASANQRGRVATIAVCVWFVAACGADRGLKYGPAELSHSKLNPTSVVGEVLFDGDILGMPMDIALLGDNLVVLDHSADSAVQVIDSRTGKLVRRFGREGAGPGEFGLALALDPVPGSQSEFWVYDSWLGRQTYVDLDEEFFKQGKLGDKIVNLQMEGPSLGPVRTDRNTSLSLGFYETGRLAVFDDDGAQIATVAKLPAGDGLPAYVRQQAYQATLVAHPSRALFAATNRYASLIEIYNSDGSRVRIKNGPVLVEPSYGWEEDGEGPYIVQGEDTRLGYVDGSASNDHLFALFSGRTREGGNGQAYMGRFVHVFDWEGNFVTAIQLDTHVAAITVDQDERVLYAIRHLPYPAIVRYSLAGALPTRVLAPVMVAAASTD
ncbi:MAG: BF3164 family lipoprotein [Gemmatimonadetes bacterium]|nr:BF3164 family lipoprotein [Gemmatimonadota bacterium]